MTRSQVRVLPGAHLPGAHDSIAHLVGELGIETAPLLTEALGGVEGHIVFECSDLEFVDSSGLAISARHMRNGGASITNAPPRLCRILEITGLDVLQA